MRRIVWFLCVVLAAGCGGGRKEALLDEALSLLRQQPDSALLIARQARPSRWAGAALRAKYGLTLALALDKNYIDSDNDSLIRPAWTYYEEHPAPDSLRMMANYQYGRICETAGDYRQAIRYYLAARELAHALQHDYYLSLVYMRLWDIHKEQYDHQTALAYCLQGHAYTIRLGDPKRICLTVCALGDAYTQVKQLEKADSCYRQALDWAIAEQDTLMQSYALNDLAETNLYLGRDQEAERYARALHRLSPNFLPHQQLAIWHRIYLARNQIDSARRQLEAMRPLLRNGRDSANYAYDTFLTEKKAHNYEAADESVRTYMALADSLMRVAMTQSATVAEKRFYEEHFRAERQSHAARKRFERLLAAFVAVLLSGLGAAYLLHRRRTEEQMAGYLALIEELQQGSAGLLPDDSRINLLSELGETLYEYADTPKQQEILCRQVRTLLTELRSDEAKKRELEQSVDATQRGLLHRLRQQVPHLQPDDYEFLTYIYRGFSAQIISLILNEPILTVYKRKSRLKKRLAESDAPDKGEFIEKMRKIKKIK